MVAEGAEAVEEWDLMYKLQGLIFRAGDPSATSVLSATGRTLLEDPRATRPCMSEGTLRMP